MAGCPQSSAAIICSFTSSDRARMLTVFAPLPRRIWVPTSAATAWRGRARSACSGVGSFRMQVVGCAVSQSRSPHPRQMLSTWVPCAPGWGLLARRPAAGRWPPLPPPCPLSPNSREERPTSPLQAVGRSVADRKMGKQSRERREGGTRSPTLALSERHDQAITLLSLGIQLPAQGMGGRGSETNRVEARL